MKISFLLPCLITCNVWLSGNARPRRYTSLRMSRMSNALPEAFIKCVQHPSSGSCTGTYQRWYYNRYSDTCKRFTWTGCHINWNRFQSQTECENQCQGFSQVNKTSICHEPIDIGKCAALYHKYRYNPKSGECEKFTYSGCGGNRNRFSSMAACEIYCMNK